MPWKLAAARVVGQAASRKRVARVLLLVAVLAWAFTTYLLSLKDYGHKEAIIRSMRGCCSSEAAPEEGAAAEEAML